MPKKIVAVIAALLAAALLLAAPVAVADPPPAQAPDAGVEVPRHLAPRRDPWVPLIDLPQQQHRPPVGDPPSPSTGDKPG